jgi:hypothetical protein
MSRMSTFPSSRLLRALVVSALGLLPACQASVEEAAGAGSTGDPGTSASSSSGSGGGPEPVAEGKAALRFAHLSPTIGAFDVCAGKAGPLLAAAGLGEGLSFGQVSRYLPAAAPADAWILVPAGAGCADPAGTALDIPWPAGAPDRRVTVVPFRSMAGGVETLTVYAYLDEPRNDHYGINLRVLDFAVYKTESSVGASIGALLIGPGEQGITELFPHLDFAAVATESPMDEVTAAGFVHTPFISVGPLRIVPNAYTEPFETSTDVPIPPGDEGNAYGVASIFVAGGLYDHEARIIVCADNAPPEGGLSRCTQPAL